MSHGDVSVSVPAEVELVRLAQRGNRAAFDELLSMHATTIVRTTTTMLGNAEEGEDAAQEAFIAAYRTIGRYEPTAPFGAWLHRIAVNKCYDHLRSRQRRMKLLEEVTSISPRSEEDQATMQTQATECQHHVHALITDLDPKNRAIVVLRFLHDMPIKDVAQTLGIPEGTVKRRLHEILELLRQRMVEEALS